MFGAREKAHQGISDLRLALRTDVEMQKRHFETCAMRMYEVKANYDSIMEEQTEATNF
jgi:hypothetical protein